MSGRLIILPKKSYNPWKPENIERVLRDERLERERQAQLDEADEKKRSEDRVQLLRTKRRTSGARSNDRDVGDSRTDDGTTDTSKIDDDAGTGTVLEHVNLFADEEKAMKTWNPMKQDYTDKKFNSYSQGPGRNLPQDRHAPRLVH